MQPSPESFPRAGRTFGFGILLAVLVAGCGSNSADTEPPAASPPPAVAAPVPPTTAPVIVSAPTAVAQDEAPAPVTAPPHGGSTQLPVQPSPQPYSPIIGGNPSPGVAPRNDAFERQTRERLDRLEAERREAEGREAARQAAESRQAQERQAQEAEDRLEARRRESEVAASQRRIEGWEREKRDIARSGSDDFNQFRMETREMRIENEQRRMDEAARR